jgi:hypothetical protein
MHIIIAAFATSFLPLGLCRRFAAAVAAGGLPRRLRGCVAARALVPFPAVRLKCQIPINTCRRHTRASDMRAIFGAAARTLPRCCTAARAVCQASHRASTQCTSQRVTNRGTTLLAISHLWVAASSCRRCALPLLLCRWRVAARRVRWCPLLLRWRQMRIIRPAAIVKATA